MIKKEDLKDLVASLSCEVPPMPDMDNEPTKEKVEQMLAHIGRTNYNKALLDVIKVIEDQVTDSNIIIPR